MRTPPLAVDNKLVLMNARDNLNDSTIVTVFLRRQADFRLPVAEGSNDVNLALRAMVPSELHGDSALELGRLFGVAASHAPSASRQP